MAGLPLSPLVKDKSSLKYLQGIAELQPHPGLQGINTPPPPPNCKYDLSLTLTKFNLPNLNHSSVTALHRYCRNKHILKCWHWLFKNVTSASIQDVAVFTVPFPYFDAKVVANLFLCHNSGVVVQRVAQHIATHALARLVVKVLEERWEVLELQHRQDVVVGIHWDLQQSGEFL